MTLESTLAERSQSRCELCTATDNLNIQVVAPKSGEAADDCVYICETCLKQIASPEKIEANHWRCLNGSMWSEVPAVQVLAWRLLNQLSSEDWAQDLLEILYLDEEILAWAESGVADADEEEETLHTDSNGSTLKTGDNVVLIKDLNVKGAGFTAKRGTVVRGISLVTNNPEHIEGRIQGQAIVILTQFVKQAN